MGDNKKNKLPLAGISAPQRVKTSAKDRFVGMRGVPASTVPINPGTAFIINGEAVRMMFFPPETAPNSSEIDASFFPDSDPTLPPINQRLFFRVFCTILNIVHEQTMEGVPSPRRFSLTTLIRRLENDSDETLPKRNVDLRKYIHHIVQLLFSTKCEVFSYSDENPEITGGHGGPTMTIEYDAVTDEQGEKEIWYTYYRINGGIQAQRELFRLQQRAEGYSLSYSGPTESQIRQMDWTAFVDERIAAAWDYGSYDENTGLDEQNCCEIQLKQLYQIAGIGEDARMAQTRLRAKFEQYVKETYGEWISDIQSVLSGKKVIAYRVLFKSK
ncbi:MAG: hypothetical protein IJL03_07045 [Lachnospiraceae bacterium]|nr:hypothetical protein [Lachnospiraceae bacterium]